MEMRLGSATPRIQEMDTGVRWKMLDLTHKNGRCNRKSSDFTNTAMQLAHSCHSWWSFPVPKGHETWLTVGKLIEV